MNTHSRPWDRAHAGGRHRAWAVLLVVTSVLVAGCAQTSSPASDSVAPGSITTCQYTPTGRPAKAVDPPSGTSVATSGNVVLTFSLPPGPVVMTLNRADAPCAVHSLETLASQGFFTGTSCHRLTTQGIFVLQCGDPSGTGRGGPGYGFASELGAAKALCSGEKDDSCVYPRGTVAMADPETTGSQFFIVYQDSLMAPTYPVVGTIDTKGLSVVRGIAARGIAPDASPSPAAPASIAQVVAG
ncbi:peptidylprolyl isomerase [Propionibacterium cyclohexanicum]|uniref:peptidylprolyl isomerase n=1 Tax=Propionibacterium cyclohexanicum TaxID=64702 RepID=UPI0015A51B80|nr:peptidylprolyl isomerase [Propionibacterium cyclohexanicum]